MLEMTEDYGFCCYESLKRYILLKTLFVTDISQEISNFLEEMENPACFRVEFVAQKLSGYLFQDEFNRNAEMFDLSEIKFAEFLLSRCIRLCKEPDPPYFSFLLVAAFLKESVFHFFLKYKCFRILYIADFCLDILYDRVFFEVFESRDFYDNLKLFCEDFFNRFSSDSTSSPLQDTAFGNYWFHIVNERLNVIDDSFSLDEIEEVFQEVYSLESLGKREVWSILRETENAESAYFDAKKLLSF
ncbi:hypothetical protein TNIN_78781 [Trichonephila inaurata madagascariensis]|uniref:Uncharacterized protein n=1 Tax=Trichonephila inaurata madagascariensis TaxID=2747483 RepID=A0A8X6YPX0_9ARAC|nr:hypothetical protein TNIN_78781 [Trichonephila inaurata madagascariensis]